MHDTALDSILYCLLSLLLLLLSAFLLTVGEFNAVHVFANGVTPAASAGWPAWLGQVHSHPAQLRAAAIKLWALWAIVPFCLPALAIILLWGRKKHQAGIVVTLACAALLALGFVAQGHGYNAGMGGYDGGEGVILLLLHCALGVATFLYALGVACMHGFPPAGLALPQDRLP